MQPDIFWKTVLVTVAIVSFAVLFDYGNFCDVPKTGKMTAALKYD